MMDYEIFKEVTAEKFKDYLLDNMKNMRMDINSINKVNRKLDAITFFDIQERECETVKIGKCS